MGAFCPRNILKGIFLIGYRTMLISVIIPHLNQHDYLKIGLEALHNQEDVTAEVEIIVVDNGSEQLPTSICGAWANVKLVSEKTPGPGPARNHGIRIARGSILAFIDADCRADTKWLSAIESAFADETTTIIGGDVRVGYACPTRPTFIEPYENIYSYRNHEHIASGFSGTGNLATRPEVIMKVGFFAGIEVAEDRDWGLRACAEGYRLRYIPEMIVFHPARKTFSELTLKWDRHIAHDYEQMRGRRFGKLRWISRAIALAGSPVIEARTLLTSTRVSGPWERFLAFLCLARIRYYRCSRMINVLLRGNSRSISGAWNRK